MVLVSPGEEILAQHINAKMDADGSNVKPGADFIPDSGSSYDIGSSGVKWKDLFLSGTLNVGTAVVPDANGGATLGNGTTGFEYVYIKDTSNTDVYRIEVVSGVLQATLVP